MVGIASYGSYIPQYRLSLDEIASVWGKQSSSITSSLYMHEKSIAGIDEDAVTMAYEASMEALKRVNFSPSCIESIFVGSESHPYAVNATSTILGEFLGCSHSYYSADLEFACKAATTGMIVTAGLLSSRKISYGLIVGSDTGQAKPHDVLEYTASSAAAAFVMSNKESECIVEMVDFFTYSSDTPDFWRRDGIRYPSHGGRFTGKPAYFRHVVKAASSLMSKHCLSASSFDYCVFHMPNGKFPRLVSKKLGFTFSQLEPSLVVDKIGNAYTASSLLGLISVLDLAKPNQLIFMVSYGSGASADAFILKTTSLIVQMKKDVYLLSKKIKEKKYITYTDYLKAKHII